MHQDTEAILFLLQLHRWEITAAIIQIQVISFQCSMLLREQMEQLVKRLSEAAHLGPTNPSLQPTNFS